MSGAAADRLVRTCQTHGTVLLAKADGSDGYACSKCGGRVARWNVVERKTGKVLEAAEDEAYIEAQRRHAVVQSAAGPRALSAGVGDALKFEFSEKKPKAGSQVVVAMAKLADAVGSTVIDIRLLRRTNQPAFVVDWRQRVKGAKEIQDQGRAWVGLELEAAKRAFVEVVGNSVAAGWIVVPLLFGAGRSVPLSPVPLPPAARKGKAAA